MFAAKFDGIAFAIAALNVSNGAIIYGINSLDHVAVCFVNTPQELIGNMA
jgi:hypothetical protein